MYTISKQREQHYNLLLERKETVALAYSRAAFRTEVQGDAEAWSPIPAIT
uniref:Uncharacterized protein n=1 Tax=Arundo donax TaxID=35708 RepID=A0A0A9E4T1_ARUDO